MTSTTKTQDQASYAAQMRDLAELQEMRAWLREAGVYSGEFLSEVQTRRLVNRTYEGGTVQFRKDCEALWLPARPLAELPDRDDADPYWNEAA
jgi:hypothetical protein